VFRLLFDGAPSVEAGYRDNGSMTSAREYAAGLVAEVVENPEARLALMRNLYEAEPGEPALQLPYRRAALCFMNWQVGRGLLNPLNDRRPGSAWWRAVNGRLLHDTAEARGQVLGLGGPPSSSSAARAMEFAIRPTARGWYRAHNASVVAGYLEHRELAALETRAERFFINLILVRVLYAHALVAAPRLALSWLNPIGPVVGDPRLTFTGIFVTLSRVMPQEYPLVENLEWYIDNEHGIGRALDLGLVLPRLDDLYTWSAAELEIPELTTLLIEGVPAYAWNPADSQPWNPPPGRLVRATRKALPAQRSRR
jgi:hypothetical protein